MSKEKQSGDGHHKSIRKRLTGTVLIPSIALILMWTGVSAYFVIEAVYVRTVASSVQDVSLPAVTALGSLQQERQLSLVYLERPQVGLRDLQAQQQEIDRPLTELRGAMDGVRDLVPDEIAQRMRELEGQLDRLPAIRAEINLRTVPVAEVNDYYNNLIDTAAGLFEAQARIVPDAKATQGGIGATDIFRAADQMSRAASLASSAYATNGFSVPDHLEFSQLVGSYRETLEKLAPFMRPEVGQHYERITSDTTWQRLGAAENALITAGPGPLSQDGGGPVVTASQWRELTSGVSDELTSLTIEQADQVSAQALADGNANLRTVIIGSALALVAAIASIVVAVRVSRTLVDRTLMTRLERLRNDSLELARTRLPNIVNRLKSGESVDLNAELPKLDHGRDEVGQVAEAFNMAQHTAVSAAVSEAKARSGVNNVFLGIAHRSQGLIHRQLQILDRMESREENAKQLEGLYQLDHLATRARRTTENLIILGGKQPGRRWRKPVWLMDVLRAAVSETEHFSRVEVEGAPEVAVAGAAVADTIHLVAELVDNATSFSPPGSTVHMSSTLVARGVIVDIADQGFGMTEEKREWANRMMAEPPEFDAMALRADSSLGLFVVAQLAGRLGVQVMFDSSRFGGTRATVLIPSEKLATGADGGGENGANGSSDTVNGSGQDPSGGHDNPAGGNGAGQPVSTVTEQRVPEPIRSKTVMNSEPEAPRHDEADTAIIAMPPVDAQPDPSAAAGSSESSPKRRRRALPQRQPQQNLVAQLRDDPESDPSDVEAFTGRTRNTLSAFHKGTRRGRDEDDPQDQPTNN